MNPFGDRGGVVRAGVKVGAAKLPLSPNAERYLVRAVVDTHVHLPDMFELTFFDEGGDLLDTAGLSIGTPVEVHGGASDSTDTKKLIAGEVTSIEAVCADLNIYTVVRGYEQAHRLQRARRTRTFVNSSDSDAVRKVAQDARVRIGTIDSTATTHDHLAQVAQTDWDFIKQRAREVGYETGVSDGEFFFRKPPGLPSAGGFLDAIADFVGLGKPKLTFKDNLLTFLPRVTGANLTTEVEVRFWDPEQAKAVTKTKQVRSGTANLSKKPDELAGAFGLANPLGVSLPAIPGLPDLGVAPSASAYAVVDRPVATGSGVDRAAEELANGLAEHVGSSFAEAEGYALGSPDLQAGTQVEIAGVPAAFAGTWTISNARHVFDEAEGGYRTRFFVSGRQERSLLGLTSLGATQGEPTRIPGLVCGIVTNNNDPDTRGRVKVALPWLSPSYESDWARVAQFGAGKKSGGLFTPEVGDEVLIGFEFGDPRRPYVLGGLRNAHTDFDLGGDAVKSSGMTAQVVRRGFVSGAGNRLVFHDELPPAPAAGPPMASEFALETKDRKIGFAVDQKAGTLKITCEPTTPTGAVEITCGPQGTISIKAGAGGSITIDGGGTLELKAQQSVKISGAQVEISSQQIKLGG
ncbi:phage baseplate assembly protein V [Krasilnikovia sp. MM14-A1004]|uniref:phage baseplate assembly protein V n=1 Tax=Krasilnikovia sp. MM14-A1004 TaxID=3373541 RepID=UPI00399CCEC9